MLIVTLPQITRERLLEQIISHPLVGGVRYNVGYESPYSPKETLERVLALTQRYQKEFWVDIKGRQLRIEYWAVANYGRIVVNHSFEVDLPAQVCFRGGEYGQLKFVRDNVIYLESRPPKVVGQGQAINVHGDNLIIYGYLTEDDKLYLTASAELEIWKFMLSFVEDMNDLIEVEKELQKNPNYCRDNTTAEYVLKIETPKGVEFISNAPKGLFEQHHIMAARDDSMINIGKNKAKILLVLEQIIKIDPEAILASCIFSSLEKGSEVSMGDWSDIRYMHELGYKHFMLSDGVSHNHFDQALAAWEDYLEIFG